MCWSPRAFPLLLLEVLSVCSRDAMETEPVLMWSGELVAALSDVLPADLAFAFVVAALFVPANSSFCGLARSSRLDPPGLSLSRLSRWDLLVLSRVAGCESCAPGFQPLPCATLWEEGGGRRGLEISKNMHFAKCTFPCTRSTCL